MCHARIPEFDRHFLDANDGSGDQSHIFPIGQARFYSRLYFGRNFPEIQVYRLADL